MKIIFLAAGQSSRMDPIGDKNFLQFGGEPLILKLLKNAHQAGLSNFIIVGNKDNFDQITQMCQAHLFLEEAVITTQPRLEEGMAGGILEGLSFVDENEPVLIHNGNDYISAEVLKSVVEAGEKADGVILGHQVENYFPGGYLEVQDNKIMSIVEKPGEGNEPSNLVNIVVHYFHKAEDLKSVLSKAESHKDDVYEVALDTLFKTKNFTAVPNTKFWQAIKYPWHVLEMMDLFLAAQEPNIHPTAEIADSAVIKGNVVIDVGAKVFENAVISGPAYIGKNSIVGNNALVRSSNIGHHSVVGFNTEVARSFVGNNVTSHMAYIGDSIIDDEVNFGAYSCTANLRLDRAKVRVNIKDEKVNSGHDKLGAIIGRKAQIGISAKLMPGCKIPVESLIRPGEIWY